MKKHLLAIALLLVVFSATADTWTDPETGIEWTYWVSDDRTFWEIYGLSVYGGVEGEVEIPSTLYGFPVTDIGDFAFSNCSGLTSVKIPSCVTCICECAFASCSGTINLQGRRAYRESFSQGIINAGNDIM